MVLTFKHTSTNVQDLITNYVKGLNGFLGLSKRGAEFLAYLLFHELNNSYGARSDIGDYYLRVWLKDRMHIKDSALSAYYTNLKDRGVIIKDDKTGRWILNPMFRVRFKDGDFEINLTYDLKMITSYGAEEETKS